MFTVYGFGMLLTLSVMADANQEKQFSQQLAKQVTIGEAVNLPSGEKDFFAIYTKTHTEKSRGGIILLHDLGTHADWPDIITPLRAELPAKGWNTLSLQLPILPDRSVPREMDQTFIEINNRINSAIDYYGEKGIYNLVLIGYSFGAIAGVKYLRNKETRRKEIIAFVGISMGNDRFSLNLKQTSIPSKTSSVNLDIPVLDIYGSLDFESVVESARYRASEAKKTQASNFSQIVLVGADHHFTGLSENLIKRVGTWLNHQAPSMLLKLKNTKGR